LPYWRVYRQIADIWRILNAFGYKYFGLATWRFSGDFLKHLEQSCSGSGFSESRIRIFVEFFGSGAGLDIIFAQAGAGLSKTLRLENFLFFHVLIFSCKNYLIT